MKSIHPIRLASLIWALCIFTMLSGQVKIGDNVTTISPSAVLELERTNQGLLIPRIALTGATDITTISSPANSLLIYNTATSGAGGDAINPGFYYWESNSGRWKGLLTSAGPAGDVWIDVQHNILSANSENQSLFGAYNLALGYEAFGDPVDPSNFVIALGSGACRDETTMGDAFVVAIGATTAAANSGINLNAFGQQTAYSNSGESVNAAGPFAAYENSGDNVNAFGTDAAYSNNENGINAFGYAAAAYNSGFEINAFGPDACHSNIGDVVNAMGLEAAYDNRGNDVNAFGVRAASNNGEDGDNLNAMGIEAARNNLGGSLNAFGEHAGSNNQGSLVNAFGSAAGENNHGWSANLFGSLSGQFNTGGEVNAMGAMSAQYNTHASVNAFGLSAAQYNVNADVNALGWRAAQYNTGFQVNALGSHAARFNNGDQVIAIGQNAVLGDSIDVEGYGNIGIGYAAASNAGPGSLNISIGYEADIPNPATSNQINIGNTIIRESDGMVRLKDFIQLTPLSSAPSTTEEGVLYYNGTDHKLYVMTNTGWQACW